MLAPEAIATIVTFTLLNGVVLTVCGVGRAANRLILRLRLVEVLLVSTLEVAHDVVALARGGRAGLHRHVDELLLLIVVLKRPLLFLGGLLMDCGTSLVG